MTFNLDEFDQAELSNWMTFNLAEHSTGNILTYAKNDHNSINLNRIPGVEMCFNKPFTCIKLQLNRSMRSQVMAKNAKCAK